MNESPEELRRKEVINKIMTFAANTYTRAFLDGPHPKTGKPYSIAELETYLEQLWNEAKEKLDEEHVVRLAKIRAEQNADSILFQLQRQRETEPQRKAQVKRDLETFNNAAKTIRTFGVNQANFNVVRQTLGSGFSVYQIREMLAAKASILSPPNQRELDQWESDRIEAHNESLLNLAERDSDQLRARVKQEAKEARVQQAQAESDRQIEAIRLKDEPFNYPALPSEFTKESLLQMVKNDTDKYRFLMTKFGNYNITARLQGRG